MSKYSGKYDFFDACTMEKDLETMWKNAHICYGEHRLYFPEAKYLFLYAPYLIVSQYGNKDHIHISLSERSHIDYQERDWLYYYITTAATYIRKYKKEATWEGLVEVLKCRFEYERPEVFKDIAATICEPKLKQLFISTPASLMNDRRFVLNCIIPQYLHSVHTNSATNKRKMFAEDAFGLYNIPICEDSANTIQIIHGKIRDFDSMVEYWSNPNHKPIYA